MKKARLILIAILLQFGTFYTATAHPASGIVVDKYGNVYFIYSKTGVVKIAADGQLSYIHKSTDGHWMCLDEQGFFSQTQPKYFERITPDKVKPAIIYAGGGSPIAVGKDGIFITAEEKMETLIRERKLWFVKARQSSKHSLPTS